jgi:aminobenzoyl-glutamate utilization protein B
MCVTPTRRSWLFAREIRGTLGETKIELESVSEVQPFEFREQKGSTDVGDVSWVVPTGGFNSACWVPGTAGHSWQAVAAGGMSIGTKGMIVATKTLAFTAIDLYRDAGLITKATEEFEERRGPDYRYEALLGDRAPPLDYRR